MWHNNSLHIAQLGQKDEMKEQGTVTHHLTQLHSQHCLTYSSMCLLSKMMKVGSKMI